MHALAKQAAHKSQAKVGAAALGGLLGLWLLRRSGVLGFLPGLRGGGGGGDDGDAPRRRRGRRRGGAAAHSEEGGVSGGGLSHEQRLLLAYDHVDRSFKELSKAQRNVELLRGDWRLGPVRLAAPFGGPDPPGFEALDLAACEPRSFMHAQLGYGRAP